MFNHYNMRAIEYIKDLKILYLHLNTLIIPNCGQF